MTAPKRRVPCRPDTSTTSPRPAAPEPEHEPQLPLTVPNNRRYPPASSPQRSCSDVCRTAFLRRSTCHVGSAATTPPHSDKLARARPLRHEAATTTALAARLSWTMSDRLG